MQAFVDQITQIVGAKAPAIVAAMGILVVGWLVALAFAAAVRGALKRTTLDNRLAEWVFGEEKADGMDVEKVAGQFAFYLAMLFVAVGFFQALGLTAVTEPLNRLLTELFGFAPQLLGAVALLALAWLGATVLRLVVTKALSKTQLDERLSAEAGVEGGAPPLEKTLGDAVYWLVFLLFLPAVLGTLGLEGLLAPVQGMLDKVLRFVPNIFTAGLTLAVGWFFARVVQRIVTNLLAAVGADSLSESVGLAPALGERKLSGLAGLLAYVLILLPVLISALNALALDAITRPASNMLNIILAAIPSIFGAALLLGLAYLVARIVAGLVTNVLTHSGFDGVFDSLGLKVETQEGGRTPSVVAGTLVSVAIMFFAGIEAFRLLGFATVSDLVADFMVLAGRILLGLVIFGVGLFLANLAANTVRTSQTVQAGLLAIAARGSITVLAAAMALRQMGLANEIINLAFGILLGSVAVAVALAFGLGGRDAAGRALEGWTKSLRSEGS